MSDWRGAGLGGQVRLTEVSLTHRAELGQNLCNVHLSDARKRHQQLPIGERGSVVLDALFQDSPGCDLLAGNKPSLSQRCKVEGAGPSAPAAFSMVIHSPFFGC